MRVKKSKENMVQLDRLKQPKNFTHNGDMERWKDGKMEIGKN